MKKIGFVYPSVIVFLLTAVPFFGFAQQQPVKKKKKFIKEVYASWGYNAEWYTHSSVHISQSALGNNYTMQSVKAHDHLGWNEWLQPDAAQFDWRRWSRC